MLNLFCQREATEQPQTVSQPVNHVIGVAGNDAEFIFGCDRHIMGKVTVADAFEDIGLRVEKKLQVARKCDDKVDHQNR